MNSTHGERTEPANYPIASALLLFLLLWLVPGCAGESDQDTEDAGRTAASSTTGPTPSLTSPTTTTSQEDLRVELAQINCALLLTLDETAEATGLLEREDNQGIFQYAKGETCMEVLAADENFFVRIEPGHPDDFRQGAQLEGVSAVSIAGVGDTARWFGGPTAGTLSVTKETSLGYLYYRIGLGRPDVDDEARLEIARTLALAALPRFPGTETAQQAQEPELITFEPDPVDLSAMSFEANLLAKEEAGEWTRGEGLVATLQLVAGAIDQTEVLRHSDLVDYSGAGVIGLAQEYLETGDDAGAQAEIARLLGAIFPSREQLEEMAGGGSGSQMNGFGASPIRFFPQSGGGSCQEEYGIDPPCLQTLHSVDLEAEWPGEYLVYAPAGDPTGGWDEARIFATVEALADSVLKYSTLTDMPPVIITIDTDDVPLSTAVVFDEDCLIYVYPVMQEFNEDYYKQVLARDVAYCLIENSFLTRSAWWTDGMATYLGGWVYPEVNLEHEYVLDLQSTELGTSIFNRYFDNWVFFEDLHTTKQASGNLQLASDVQAAGPSVLAPFWHSFNERLTDVEVRDIGDDPRYVPYDPPPFEDVQITGPTEMTPAPAPFSVRRAQLTVPSGLKACVDYKFEGGVMSSWREGPVESAGDYWSGYLPSELSGVSTFLVTATKTGAKLTMNVKQVIDESKDCKDQYLDESIEPVTACDLGVCDPTSFLLKVPPSS